MDQPNQIVFQLQETESPSDGGFVMDASLVGLLAARFRTVELPESAHLILPRGLGSLLASTAAGRSALPLVRAAEKAYPPLRSQPEKVERVAAVAKRLIQNRNVRVAIDDEVDETVLGRMSSGRPADEISRTGAESDYEEAIIEMVAIASKTGTPFATFDRNVPTFIGERLPTIVVPPPPRPSWSQRLSAAKQAFVTNVMARLGVRGTQQDLKAWVGKVVRVTAPWLLPPELDAEQAERALVMLTDP